MQFCGPDDVAATLAREGHLEPVSDSDLEVRLAAMRLGDEPSWVLPEEHSMSIGGVFDREAIDAEAWRRLAGELGVDETAVLDRVHRMTADAPAAFTAALDDVEDRDGSVTDIRTRLLHPTPEFRPT